MGDNKTTKNFNSFLNLGNYVYSWIKLNKQNPNLFHLYKKLNSGFEDSESLCKMYKISKREGYEVNNEVKDDLMCPICFEAFNNILGALRSKVFQVNTFQV